MRPVEFPPMVPNPAPMIAAMEAVIGTRFIAFTGDTTYTVESFYRRGVIVSVRCRQFGWKVTNPSARFSYDHVQACLAEGRWTVNQPIDCNCDAPFDHCTHGLAEADASTIACPYCGSPVQRTVDFTDALDRELCGEHCWNCHLPFGVAEDGSAFGQDDPRY